MTTLASTSSDRIFMPAAHLYICSRQSRSQTMPPRPTCSHALHYDPGRLYGLSSLRSHLRPHLHISFGRNWHWVPRNYLLLTTNSISIISAICPPITASSLFFLFFYKDDLAARLAVRSSSSRLVFQPAPIHLYSILHYVPLIYIARGCYSLIRIVFRCVLYHDALCACVAVDVCTLAVQIVVARS